MSFKVAILLSPLSDFFYFKRWNRQLLGELFGKLINNFT
ncbi:hypothetical protein MWLf4_1147 [Limosilactobacillus fermentum]|nr:hypothetical protein MWLf4_1147 [Limosilactobacillus fermentum]